MLGASREALAACEDTLDARRADPGFPALPDELLSVASLLDREGALLSTLADSGQPTAVRETLVRQVLGGRIGDLAVDIVLAVVAQRWSSASDLVLALEHLAFSATFALAEDDGSLDATEDELFTFGRALDGSPDLQMALTDPAQNAATKAAIVADLLSDRTSPATRKVLEYAVGHLHGRRIDAAVDELVALAAILAAGLSPRVGTAVAEDAVVRLVGPGPAAWGPMRMGLAVPNILTLGDFGRLASLVAPRVLAVVGGLGTDGKVVSPAEMSEAFHHARRIYGLYDANDGLLMLEPGEKLPGFS